MVGPRQDGDDGFPIFLDEDIGFAGLLPGDSLDAGGVQGVFLHGGIDDLRVPIRPHAADESDHVAQPGYPHSLVQRLPPGKYQGVGGHHRLAGVGKLLHIQIVVDVDAPHHHNPLLLHMGRERDGGQAVQADVGPKAPPGPVGVSHAEKFLCQIFPKGVLRHRAAGDGREGKFLKLSVLHGDDG